MGVRLAGNQNAAIFDDFWQSRTPTYYTYFKREFDKKGENCGVLAGSNAVTCGYSIVTDRRRPARVLLNCRANNCQSSCPWDRIATASFLRLFWLLFSFYPLLTVLCGSAATGSFVTAIRGLVAATASSSLLIVFGFHLHSLLR